MDQKIKTKWLKALRGGKYAQTQNALRDRDGHCCLGVLCNIIAPKKWHRDTDGTYDWGDETSTIYPPPETLKEIGLHFKSAKALASKNDAGKSFAEIAKYIEKNF